MYRPSSIIGLPFRIGAILSWAASCSGCGPHATPAASPQASVRATKPGIFEDATQRAGISFTHTNGSTLRYPLLETMGGGCAFLDYDGDGWQDILLLSSGEFGKPGQIVALYRNNRGDSFTDVTAGSGLDLPLGYGQGVAVGDYDNDGRPDIFVAGYGGCRLFHNETGHPPDRSRRAYAKPGDSAGPPPRFRDVTAAAGLTDTDQGVRWAAGAVWGDYDRDGRLDLYVIHYAVWTPAIDRKCPRPDGTPGFCSPALYDGDTGRLFHNEGGGRFKDVTRSAGLDRSRGRGLAAVWADLDGDGWPDLYVADDRDPNLLFRNMHNGTFTEIGVEAGVALGGDGVATSGMGVAAGDYDHTARLSLFVTNLNGEGYSLFHNEGGGRFAYATDQAGLKLPTFSTSAWGVAFLDYDRDGWPDLITANGHVNPFIDQDMPGVHYEEPMGLFRNAGDGRFEDRSAEAGAMTRLRSRRGMAVGDFDNDGRIDVLCINRNAPANLFRNASVDANHWISLELVGTRSNRDGAGAKVTVECGSVRQTAQCQLGSSYASSNDKRLHFGLAGAESINLIQVEWPSGARTRLTGVRADAFYRIGEEGRLDRVH